VLSAGPLVVPGALLGPSCGSGVLGGPTSANAELAIGGKPTGTKLFGSSGGDAGPLLDLSEKRNI